MRTILALAACAFATACMKVVPIAPEVPQVVTVISVPEPPPLVIYEEPEAGPPVQTWMSEEEIKEAKRQRGECVCDQGDPLCECVE